MLVSSSTGPVCADPAAGDRSRPQRAATGVHARAAPLSRALGDDAPITGPAELAARGVPVVAKTLDWQSFDWLHDQHDLRVALDTPGLTLYQVTTRVDLGARVTADGRRDAAVVKRSPVRYDVPAGAAGTLELAEPYDPAWRMGLVAPTRTLQGTMSFPIGPEAETIGFTHWPVALAGDLISVGSALALIAGLAVGRRRRR